MRRADEFDNVQAALSEYAQRNTIAMNAVAGDLDWDVSDLAPPSLLDTNAHGCDIDWDETDLASLWFSISFPHFDDPQSSPDQIFEARAEFVDKEALVQRRYA